MTILITGGSGFIGTALTTTLMQRGHKVKILDLQPPKLAVEFRRIDLTAEPPNADVFTGVDAVVHLVGFPIFARWNDRIKKRIYDSRILSTRNLVSSLGQLSDKPHVLVSASAIGYYGDRGEEDLYESSAPGEDFLAKVCVDWEREARNAESFGIRTVQIRTAPVLGKGGLLTQMLPAYRFGLGGPLGSGAQWFPWVHLSDIAGIYLFAIENGALEGPVNSCAPQQVRNREFSDELARVLRRPAFFRMPKFILRAVLGGLADAIVASEKVYPKKLLENGYPFLFPNLNDALRDVLRKGDGSQKPSRQQ